MAAGAPRPLAQSAARRSRFRPKARDTRPSPSCCAVACKMLRGMACTGVACTKLLYRHSCVCTPATARSGNRPRSVPAAAAVTRLGLWLQPPPVLTAPIVAGAGLSLVQMAEMYTPLPQPPAARTVLRSQARGRLCPASSQLWYPRELSRPHSRRPLLALLTLTLRQRAVQCGRHRRHGNS